MFLEKDGSFTVYHCHIQALAVVTFKLYNNPSEATFCDIFVRQENKYNFSKYRVWNTESKQSLASHQVHIKISTYAKF